MSRHKKEVKLNFESRSFFTFKLNCRFKTFSLLLEIIVGGPVCNKTSPNSFYMLGRGKTEIRAKFQRVSKESKVILYTELYSNLACKEDF